MSGLLAVPAPTLDYKVVGGGYAALENEVKLHLAPVQFPDGASVSETEVRKASLLLYRWNTPAATTEVWNDKIKAWQPIGAQDLYEAAGIPLIANRATPTGWDGVVIPIGGKDQWGHSQFAPSIAHYPQYRVRAVFSAKVEQSEFEGIGAESPAFEFISLTENARFGVGLTPDSPAEATHFKLFLKNAAGQIAGLIEVDADGTVALSNFGGGGLSASVVLQPDGDIRLSPAAGKRVVIAGDLDVGHVRYESSGGGKKNLF
ncbi:MAG: hypothetical protein JWN94_4337 [Betaproteobacteria bacterium]|nr:hypothetical protein [Betaproteobacteria bacterium]